MKQIKLAGIVFILLAGIAGACFGSMAREPLEPAGSFHNLVLPQADYIVVEMARTLLGADWMQRYAAPDDGPDAPR